MIQNPVVSGGGSTDTVTLTLDNEMYGGSWILADGTEIYIDRSLNENYTITVPKGQLAALRITLPNGPIIIKSGETKISYSAYHTIGGGIQALSLAVFVPMSDLVFDLDD